MRGPCPTSVNTPLSPILFVFLSCFCLRSETSLMYNLLLLIFPYIIYLFFGKKKKKKCTVRTRLSRPPSLEGLGTRLEPCLLQTLALIWTRYDYTQETISHMLQTFLKSIFIHQTNDKRTRSQILNVTHTSLGAKKTKTATMNEKCD